MKLSRQLWPSFAFPRPIRALMGEFFGVEFSKQFISLVIQVHDFAFCPEQCEAPLVIRHGYRLFPDHGILQQMTAGDPLCGRDFFHLTWN